jgi:hypothetical protein
METIMLRRVHITRAHQACNSTHRISAAASIVLLQAWRARARVMWTRL